MKKSCLETSTYSFCNLWEDAIFCLLPYLYPIQKGYRPFCIWSINTVVGLKSVAPDGSTKVLVAIYPFIILVCMGPIFYLHSHAIPMWFHDYVFCRYRIPIVIKGDQGAEYSKKICEYIKCNRVWHHLISMSNSRVKRVKEQFSKEIWFLKQFYAL